MNWESMCRIYTTPVEFPDPIPFEKDETHAAYDRDAVSRFWRVLQWSDAVFKEFRARFIGKASPVHFFWGSFDLAVTRFSGRPAPPRPGADAVTAEAYSHEVSSAGFWPGGSGVDGPAYYAYAAPEPPGFAQYKVQPGAAFYHPELHEYLLMYDDVRQADSPREFLLEFLQSTYEAAADVGKLGPQGAGADRNSNGESECRRPVLIPTRSKSPSPASTFVKSA